MVSKELVDYIKTQLANGVAKEALSQVLLQSGYSPKDVQDGFLAATLSAGVYTAPQQLPADNYSTPKNPLKKFLFIFVPLVILMSAGGGGAYYYFEVFSNTPEKVIGRMFENLKNLKSAVYSSETKILVKMDDFAVPSSLPIVHPDIESSPSANPKSSYGPVEAATIIKVNGESEFTNLSGNNGSLGASVNLNVKASGVNMGFDAQAEVINIGENIYFQITQFPGMGFLEPNMFVNQWVRLNMKDLGDRVSKLNPENKESTLSQQEERKIAAMFQNPKLFVLTKTLGNEKINDVDCFHYQFSIDKEELKSLILELATFTSAKSPSSQYKIEDLQKNIDEFLAMLIIEDGEVWIGKRDFQLYKVTQTISTRQSEKLPAEIKISLSGTFADHNKPVTVSAPVQYKTFDEVFGPLTGSYPITYPQPQDNTDVNPLTTPYQREVLGARDYQSLIREIFRNL